MARITVTRQADGTFHVQTPAGTSHQVSVPAGFPSAWAAVTSTPGTSSGRRLSSFFEHEPATSVLHEFSLDVISRYFPGYPAEIPARLRGSDPGTPG